MNVPIGDKMDSSELQSLFDSISASVRQQDNSHKDSNSSLSSIYHPLSTTETFDSSSTLSCGSTEMTDEELQALFDEVYIQKRTIQDPPPDEHLNTQKPAPLKNQSVLAEEMFQQIGQLTRRLHSMLRELGYDEILEKMTSKTIPDTRERLQYITQMTEEAAQKVLNATEVASPLIETIGCESKKLAERWEEAFNVQISSEQFHQLGLDTKLFLSETHDHSDVARHQLMDIMMAQDFQDLTGQVIKKVLDLAQDLESQLLGLLIENIPSSKQMSTPGLLNGPVIKPINTDDVVTNQIQVDNLLESLGF